jgi:hypothetical protein
MADHTLTNFPCYCIEYDMYTVWFNLQDALHYMADGDLICGVVNNVTKYFKKNDDSHKIINTILFTSDREPISAESLIGDYIRYPDMYGENPLNELDITIIKTLNKYNSIEVARILDPDYSFYRVHTRDDKLRQMSHDLTQEVMLQYIVKKRDIIFVAKHYPNKKHCNGEQIQMVLFSMDKDMQKYYYDVWDVEIFRIFSHIDIDIMQTLHLNINMASGSMKRKNDDESIDSHKTKRKCIDFEDE